MHEQSDQERADPDDVRMELLAARLAGADCRQLGYILDGFPHTAAQVEACSALSDASECGSVMVVEACTDVPNSTCDIVETG